MLSSSVGIHSKMVEIFENERYSPVSGWSSKGLLPNDRKWISNCDGSCGWNSFQDASDALLSFGWSWDPDTLWELVIDEAFCDAEGWSYSPDFSSLTTPTSGAAKKGMIHFVRRRRYVRSKIFDVHLIAKLGDWTCDHCDLQEVEKLSHAFLMRLSAASIARHPRNITEIKMINLKNQLIDALSLRNTTTASGNEVTDNAGPVYQFEMIDKKLELYVNSCKTTLSMASSTLMSGSTADNIQQRAVEINVYYFTLEERTEIARLLLRKFDTYYNYHCDKPNCGVSCIYAVEPCPNAGCDVVFSRKWGPAHDMLCPQKIIPCVRLCGDEMQRRLLDHHLEQECVLRPVTCPFCDIGCRAELVFKTLPPHLKEAQSDHLLLAVTRLREHQSVIASVHTRIGQLEQQNEAQSKEIVKLEAALAACTIALKASETKNEKHLKDQISSVESKTNRRIQDVHAELNGEIGRIKKVLMEQK